MKLLYPFLLFFSIPLQINAQPDPFLQSSGDVWMAAAVDRYQEGRFSEALLALDSALIVWQRNNQAVSPHYFANRGAILVALTQYDDAVRQFRSGLNIAQYNADRWSQALLLGNLGNTFRLLKRYPEAQQALLQAAGYFQSLNAMADYTATLYQLGDCYLENGQISDAEYYSFLLKNGPGSESDLFTVLLQGKLLLKKQEYTTAYDRLFDAYHQAQTAKWTDWEELTAVLLIQCYVSWDERQRAGQGAPVSLPDERAFYRVLQQSLRLAESRGDQRQRLESHAALSRYFENKGDYPAAFSHLERYQALRDSVLSFDKIVAIEHLEAQYRTREQQQQIELLEKEKRVRTVEYERNQVLARQQLQAREFELLSARAEAERRQNLLRILEQQRELDTCALQNASFALENAEILNHRNNTEIELLNRDNALQQAAIARQRLGLLLLLTLGLLGGSAGWLFYRRLHDRRLEALRNRLSRDLHDDLGSALSSIALNGALAAQTAEPEKMRQVLARISEEARNTSARVRDLVWALHPDADTLDETLARMRQFATGLLEEAGVDLRFDADPNLETLRLDLEKRRHFYLFFKEVVHNIAKHAATSKVNVDIRLEGKRLRLIVQDDGRGFDPTTVRQGNGLDNLSARAALLGGKYALDTRPGQGTRVELAFKIRR